MWHARRLHAARAGGDARRAATSASCGRVPTTSCTRALHAAGRRGRGGTRPACGGRGVEATSVYVRDPDGNLLEIHEVPMTRRTVPSARELFGPAGTPRVVVVGAGFGGIAAGVKLKRAGIDTFTIYESSLGIGGTWWDNTYPGAEVDVGSHLYSLLVQAARLDPHARQASRSCRSTSRRRSTSSGCARTCGSASRCESATWDDDRHVWTVHARRRHRRRVPRARQRRSASSTCRAIPTGPGLDDFAGPEVPHRRGGSTSTTSPARSSRWSAPGSSATQVVPAIQPIVQQLYVFQREPGLGHAQGRARLHRRRARARSRSRGGGGGNAGG